MARIVSIIASLNPAAALFGPIFQKEVRTAGRRRSTYVLRGLYCAGLLVILVGAFLVYRFEYSGRTAVMRLQAMQELAPKLTLVVAWFQFAVLFLASPILAAGSVCDERRARSLDVLMTTPMRAGQIVLGKLSSRIVQLVILALLATPALLAVRVFGGLSAEVVLAASCVSISTAVLGAALALMFSVRQKRATIAGLFGVLTLVLVQFGPGLAEGVRYQLVNEYVEISPYRDNVLVTCAPATLGGIAESVVGGQPLPRLELNKPDPRKSSPGVLIGAMAKAGIVDLGPMWVLNTGYNLILAAVATLYTTLVLRGAMKKVESRESLLGSAPPPRKRRKKRAGAEAEEVAEEPSAEDSHERFREGDRVVADNPVLWREIRRPMFGSRRLFRFIACGTAVAMVLLYWYAGVSHMGLHGALAFIGCAALIFQAVFLTSGPFAGEREARTWDVLLSTTLSPGQILRGKYLGALRGFWFIPAVVVLDFVIGAAFGYIRPIGVMYLAMIYSGPALLLTATGLFLSLRFKKAVTAGALNLGVALTLWGFVWVGLLVLPMVLGVALMPLNAVRLIQSDLVVDGFLDNHFMQAVDGIYAFNPVALIDVAVDPCLLEKGPRGPAVGPFQTALLRHKLGMTDCTLVVLAVFGGYCLLTGAVLGMARMRFRAWSGRAS